MLDAKSNGRKSKTPCKNLPARFFDRVIGCQQFKIGSTHSIQVRSQTIQIPAFTIQNVNKIDSNFEATVQGI